MCDRRRATDQTLRDLGIYREDYEERIILRHIVDVLRYEMGESNEEYFKQVWLNSPRDEFDNRSPRQTIADGDVHKVLGLVWRIEHN